jgi:iron-sulfur cluster repair protein YtfE (RIC family)
MNLADALEREHRDIDGGIEAFTDRLADGVNDDEPLRRAMAGLRRHIYLEEEFLFPPLREAGMVMPIFVMLREHGNLWDSMDQLDALLTPEAGTDASVLLEKCRELLAKLDMHNSKEEPIIYPQADVVPSGEANAKMKDFLASGSMPQGWVCAKASAGRG